MILNDRESEHLYKFCCEYGVCKSCILRYSGFNFYSLNFFDLENTFQQFYKSFSESDKCSKKKLNHCSSCLGLLTQSNLTTTLEKIINEISLTKLNFKCFQLSVSIPVTVLLRDNILLAKLKKKIPSLFDHFNDLPSIKDIWRHLIIEAIISEFDASYKNKPSFQIDIILDHKDAVQELNSLYQKYPHLFHPVSKSKKLIELRSSHLNQSSIGKIIEVLGDDGLSDLSIEIPTNPYQLSKVRCFFHPMYIVGKYNKFSRCLSQTPWYVDGEKKMNTSVQELIIGEIEKIIPSEKFKFSASGREDVDVQMLGRGRPFVVELIKPQKGDIDEESLVYIQNTINSNYSVIKVQDLQMSDKNQVTLNLRKGEIERSKEYTALCCIDRPFTSQDMEAIFKINNLEIYQKTPIRVLHRRSLVTRKRIIYNARAEKVESKRNLFKIHLMTEAGTYVKEFIHSDFGRTRPSLSNILNNCKTDILQLDVTKINIDWPPIKNQS